MNLKKSLLTGVVTLSTASFYFAQSDSLSRSKDIESVVIKGVTDIAKDRKTPVAVSTIKEAQIVERLGNQEFPEILNTTPSVYATKGGGGFGDGKMNIRGFSQNNIAVMINGMPVNDMENGSVYWSNWSGLSDVTSAMQVQRGLGASKLAIASVGGTVNVLTRAADKKMGAIVSASAGNDGYHKTLFAYNTGKGANGLSTSFLMSRTAGAMYADGTNFEGYNYYWALGYQKPGSRHDFQFTITGAPQWHNQRSFAITIDNYIKYGDGVNTPNRRYNSDWGWRTDSDGVKREYSMRRNYYHKPIMSLNWDWNISSNSKLNTVLYASFGRGGATNTTGAANGKKINSFRDAQSGLYNVDSIIGENTASTPEKGVLIRNASVNSHNWYGVISSFNHKINDNLKFSVGVDGRYYKGYHYNIVSDLLGGRGYIDENNLNLKTPNVVTNGFEPEPSWNPFGGNLNDISDRIAYSSDGEVLWYGGFGQLEYSTEKLSAFLQGSISNQGFQRIDNFIIDGVTKSKLGEVMNAKTGFKNIIGFNIKGGANYNINENHNVFANIGYYERQPFFNGVYRSNENIVAKGLTNEKIFGLELGYGLRYESFSANINLYRTTWDDRYLRRSRLRDEAGKTFYAEINNLSEIHQGLEFDANLKLTNLFALNGMFSIGDWHYSGEADATLFDDNNKVYNLPGTTTNNTKLYLDNAKVGEAAQMTAGLGLNIKPIKNISLDTNWRYVNDLYASLDLYNFSNKKTAEKGTLKLPSYNLFDLGLSIKIPTQKSNQYFILRGNVYNVFDTTYIAESNTSNHIKTLSNFKDDAKLGTAQAQYDKYLKTGVYNGIDRSNQVFFGFGRTWTATVSFNF